MSEFVPLKAHVKIVKGKPPVAIPYSGSDALPYLNPEYLRGTGGVVLARSGSDSIVTSASDTVVLWDGSNAGEFFRAKPGIMASTMAQLACDDTFDPDYFYHAAKHSEWFLKGQTNGTGIPHVDREILEALHLFRPPQPAQRVIARILDTLDTQIEKTQSLIAKLEQVKEGLLHDLLTRGVDENGELRPSAAEAPTLYKESALGLIPREWECPRLWTKLAVRGGKRLPAGHQYADVKTRFKYLRVTDFFKRSYDLEELESLHEHTFNALQRYEIHEGELFISIAGSLGFAGVHRTGTQQIQTILTENAARLVPQVDCNPDFITACLNGSVVQAQIGAEKGTGGGVPKLALFRIESLLLPWPSSIEQNLIAYRVASFERQIEAEREQSRHFTTVKSGLMDDLLTGRVRVTPLLNREPAEAT